MSDITSQSLTSLVKNIKDKKLSSEEITKAFVDRSEKSKELNSYITEDFSNAIEKAKKFDQSPKGNFMYYLNTLEMPKPVKKYCPDKTLWTKKRINKDVYLLKENQAVRININIEPN